jgi:hypothetical protein
MSYLQSPLNALGAIQIIYDTLEGEWGLSEPRKAEYRNYQFQLAPL